MVASENEIRDWLSIAKEAVLLAGGFLFRHHQSNIKVNTETGRDVKLVADVKSERIILNYLKARSRFSILSEENGLLVGKKQGFMWIVDPLDGSLNYLRGVPFCCVSIGLWKDSAPVLGAIYDFNRKETFSGIAGKAAWLNGRRIRVSGVCKKDKAVLCTGFPVNAEFSSKRILSFINDICSYKKVRLLGSAALSIAYVASGRADVYYENNIMLWDVAGGIAIASGAGGRFSVENTSKGHLYNVCVSNGHM